MYVEEKLRGDVLTWTIRRPERFNALGTSIGDELAQKIDDLKFELKGRDGPRVLVLTASPLKAKNDIIWIAGGDLKELSHLSSPQQGKVYASTLNYVGQALEQIPIPVITQIHGSAIGGGAELALFGDIRLGTIDAHFVFKQLEVGLAPGYGGTQRLVDLVGLGKAQKWLFLQERVDPHELLANGVLHEVVQTFEELDRKTNEVATKLRNLNHHGIKQLKKMFLNARRSDLGKSYGREIDLFKDLWMKPQHAKFLEKYVEKPRD